MTSKPNPTPNPNSLGNVSGKLIVTPEGRPDVWLVAPTDLAKWLDARFERQEYIHCFIANDNSGMAIGADWERPSFDKYLNNPDNRWAVLTSDDGAFAGHRLVLVEGRDRYVFDIGAITPGDLEVKEAFSNNNGSGNSTASMPSPDLGEGKEK